MRYRATLAYDGTAYQGFQRQIADTPTIQLAVEKAIRTVSGQSATVNGAGRTDAGVHATGQVIAFDVEWTHGEHALLRAINANLPDDIALQDIAEAPGFHPRFDAVSRLYRYRVFQGKQRQPVMRLHTWFVRWDLNLAFMAQAARMLEGEHNFAAFGKPPQGENTVRHVYQSRWYMQPQRTGVLWIYNIEANAFLQHMVRRIVWHMIDVGRGKESLMDFESLFRRAQLPQEGSIAPPQGLTLEQVRYAEGLSSKHPYKNLN
ncbi:MAG: tRNA pseudouridine(38-40) synthase TruA [Anaerolineae bacterium]|nr:tRNA pseudouridine(38-40) synthase TruA [Anaerolineae bacterium]